MCRIILMILLLVPNLFAGIAQLYRNDVGIQNDPRVLLFDGFENYQSPSGLMRRNGGLWDAVGGLAHERISTQYKIAGSKSFEFDMPITAHEVGPSLATFISPGERQLFCRTYFRYD